MLYTNYGGIASWMAEESKNSSLEEAASALPPAIFSLAQEAIQDRILNTILDELIFNSKPEVRVWISRLASPEPGMDRHRFGSGTVFFSMVPLLGIEELCFDR